MARSVAIWDNIPEWSGPERLFELMRKCQAKTLTRAEDNEFTSQLLRLVVMKFMSDGLFDPLNAVKADIEVVIQDAAMHLRRKSLNGLNMKAEGWRPMMSIMNLAVHRFVLSAMTQYARRQRSELAITDHQGEDHTADDFGSDASELRELGDLAEYLKEAEDQVIGDIVCSAALADRLGDLYAVIAKQILTHRTPLPHSSLPAKLKVVSHELHGLIVSRVLRVICGFPH